MEKELFFENKRYISSREAAHVAGFTHDYISKLCRYGKISGRKVGHGWYVEAESFQKYLEESSQTKQERVEELSERRRSEYLQVVSPVRGVRTPRVSVFSATAASPEPLFDKKETLPSRFSLVGRNVASAFFLVLLLVNVFFAGVMGLRAYGTPLSSALDYVTDASGEFIQSTFGAAENSSATLTAQVGGAVTFVQSAVNTLARIASSASRVFGGFFAFLGGGEGVTRLSDLGTTPPYPYFQLARLLHRCLRLTPEFRLEEV